MGDDKAKRFFKSLSKPTVGWFYLICAGLCLVLFVTKHVLERPIYGHDAILLLITIYLAITECYVNFTEEEEHKKTETFSSAITGNAKLVLVTSTYCQYCTNYLYSSAWKQIKQLLGNLAVNYDVNIDSNKLNSLGINTVTSVPAMYFYSSRTGAISYNDDIYNTTKVYNAFKKQ